jgi:RNA-directed DNA polymerase
MVFISECTQRSLKQIEWDQVYWPKCEKKIADLQERIYQASLNNNRHKTHYYQTILINLPEAKLLAVRRVTTENKGRRTGGIDKQIITTSQQKLKLTWNLRIDGKAMPIRRIFIPKAGKNKKRPLGIPTVKDRAKQMLLKLALEPEWEAKFEPSSYGFRPGRTCHDAIEHIFTAVRYNGKKRISGIDKWVLDADLRGCYDNINHNYLLNKLNTTVLFRKQIKAWLKAGIFEGYLTTDRYDEVITNDKGTPQGGIISPLLSNIALNGLEAHLKEWVGQFPDPTGKYKRPNEKREALTFVRYADDFVVIYKDKNRLEEARLEIQNWLRKTSKLELSDTKTKITEIRYGFNFLGFRIMTLKRHGIPRTKIYPSKDAQNRITSKIKQPFKHMQAASQYDLIKKLRPIVLGWANYYKYCECTKVFCKMDYVIYNLIRTWAFRRHRTTSREYAMHKYFPGTKTVWKQKEHHDRWVFKCKEQIKGKETQEIILPKMAWITSVKFTKIKGSASPYNGDFKYWLKRSQKYGGFTETQTKLLIKQNYICPECKTYITPYSNVQIDHILGRKIPNANNYSNLQLLHIGCHLAKTRANIKIK